MSHCHWGYSVCHLLDAIFRPFLALVRQTCPAEARQVVQFIRRTQAQVQVNLQMKVHLAIAREFAYSSGNCKELSKWLITGLKEQEIKKAIEAFQLKFKKKEDILYNPILDDTFYLRLKSDKRLTASKSNIDIKKRIPQVFLQDFRFS